MLDDFGFLVLEAVKQGLQHLEYIVTYVADKLNLEEDQDLSEHVMEVVELLAKSSLIEIEIGESL